MKIKCIIELPVFAGVRFALFAGHALSKSIRKNITPDQSWWANGRWTRRGIRVRSITKALLPITTDSAWHIEGRFSPRSHRSGRPLSVPVPGGGLFEILAERVLVHPRERCWAREYRRRTKGLVDDT
jgi:hypothetical protein